MFSRSFQPSIVSLFSSTGSDPFTDLWAVQKDEALPEDSFIHLLNDESSLPPPPTNQSLVSDDDPSPSRQLTRLAQTVLHIQSPTLPTTFIRCPSVSSDLHLRHPWLHIQVKRLGREWSFELGIVDHAGREGIIRCSTFKVTPSAPRSTHYSFRLLLSEAAVIEAIFRFATAPPSPPHVSPRFIASPNLMV
jgi:hypothetical protein